MKIPTFTCSEIWGFICIFLLILLLQHTHTHTLTHMFLSRRKMHLSVGTYPHSHVNSQTGLAPLGGKTVLGKPENCVHFIAFSTAFLDTGLKAYPGSQSNNHKLSWWSSFSDLKVLSQAGENPTEIKGRKRIYSMFLGFYLLTFLVDSFCTGVRGISLYVLIFI